MSRFREELEAVLTEHERAGIETADVLGDPEEFAVRAVQATAPVASPWDELVGPFTASEGVQARLGISRQAVAAKASRRRLLRVVTTDGDDGAGAGGDAVRGAGARGSLARPVGCAHGRRAPGWMRARVTLEEPGDLAGFPMSRPPARLHRVCRAENATWWYSSDGSGRFDLDPPDGTCYFATDDTGAIRETSRLGPVTPAWIAAREVRVVASPNGSTRLAAATRKAAGRYGVTNEVFTLLPYELPARWAAAFRANGFDGIRYRLRHDTRARPAGVALFGAAGHGSGSDGASRRLDPDEVRAAGVRVIEPPHSSVLPVVQ